MLGFVASRVSGLVTRYGYKGFLIFGPLLISAGLILLAHLTPSSSYLTNVLPAFILIPIGIGMSFMPVIAAATSGVATKHAGLASGLINTSQQMGGALGLAVLSGVAVSVSAATLHPKSIAALAHGYNDAFLVGIIFMVLASIVASTVIKQEQLSYESD